MSTSTKAARFMGYEATNQLGTPPVSAATAPTAVPVQPARYVTVALAAKMLGLTVAAIRKRVQRGQWIEGKEWRRGPDGRIWVDTEGIVKWVEGTV